MQFLRRIFLIRPSFRFLSSYIVDVTPSTSQKELHEISKLMQNYNNSHVPIRTYALFEWMINITNIKPDFLCYLHIIRACSELNNLNICQKIHQFIENDQTLQLNEYHQLQVKLIYMYGKIKNIELAEQIFHQAKRKNSSLDTILYGTMFKAYNMNGQPEKTIQLYENEILKKKSIELDPIVATCVLNACSDCHRLDIGEYVHNEVRRLKLLDSPNIRLATAIMDMYCNCHSIDRAQTLFNQLLPNVDHIAYSTLMKAYLSLNQPIKVLDLFKQFQSSSLRSDSVFYLNIIHASTQLGLSNQAKSIHHSIPSNLIEKNLSLQIQLIDMHAHCLHLNEAHRLFNLLKQKDNYSLASLIHGYAIHGQGQKALKLFEETKIEVKFNERVYKMILYACAFTGGLVKEAQEIYKIIPEKYKTPEIAAAMISVLARASLFDEVQSFIHRYQSTSQNVSPLWFAFFMTCYHSKNIQYAKLIYDQIKNDPIVALLFSDMMNLVPSKEVLDYFRQEKLGKCWTEIENDIYEFHDILSLNSEFKSVDINWEIHKNDLKQFYCGHTALRLAISKNLISTLSDTNIQLTKTKPICSICHEEIKQLSLTKQRNIILRDSIRIHYFHKGKCSCHDQF